MTVIRITRNITLNQPLLNSVGERVDKLRLDGSFALHEKDNEQYISYSKADDKWTINIDSIIKEITDPMQDKIDTLTGTLNTLITAFNLLKARVDVEHPINGT